MKAFVSVVLFALLISASYANHLANVKAIHAIADGPDVDLYIGGVLTRSGVPYGSFTDYVPFVEGEYLFEITQAGVIPEDGVLISQTITLHGTEYYTFAAVGSLVQPETYPLSIFVIEDTVDIPSSRAILRTLYLSPTNQNVDVVTDGDDFWTDVAYPGAGDPEYITLSANFPYKVSVKSTVIGSSVALAGPTFIQMLPNTANTIFVIGISGSTSSPLTIVFDQEFVTGQVSPSSTSTRTPSQTPTMTPTAAPSQSPTATRSFNTSATATQSISVSRSATTIVTRSPFRTLPVIDDDDGGFTKSPSPLFATPFVAPSRTRDTVVFTTPTANPAFSPFLSRTPFRDTQATGEDPFDTTIGSFSYYYLDSSSSGASVLLSCVFLIVCTFALFI